MKKYIIFLIIFFIACSSSPKPPQWYNKIYNDNNNFIYATGVGNSKKEAIANALANASAKISVIVKSNFKSLKYQYQGNDASTYSNNSLLNIETKTNPITFSEYKILKLKQKDKYYVLIKIDRIKNAKNMCNNINIQPIDKSNLNIFLNYKKIINLLNKKIQKLQNINALYPICKNRLKKIKNLKENIIKKHNNLNISVYSNNQFLKNIIENILNIKSSSIGNIKVYIKEQTKYKKIGEYKIATIYLNLNIKSNNHSKNYYLTCAASSMGSFTLAKELAYQECKTKLKQILNN